MSSTKPTVASLAADVASLKASIAATNDAITSLSALILGGVVGPAAPAAPAAKSKARTFATKAEREAGKGFPCECGRTNLRLAPKPGSYHNRPDGTLHQL
jgi:hypothetical protein